MPEWTLGDRLRKARVDARMKQAEMADALETNTNTLAGYELDRVRPKRIILNAWADLTGVDRVWLATGEVSKGEPTVTGGKPRPRARRTAPPDRGIDHPAWDRRADRPMRLTAS